MPPEPRPLVKAPGFVRATLRHVVERQLCVPDASEWFAPMIDLRTGINEPVSRRLNNLMHHPVYLYAERPGFGRFATEIDSDRHLAGIPITMSG